MNVVSPDQTLYSPSVEQTMAIGAAVAQALRPGDLVGLIGELGAGKTQFVRGLARGMGVDPSRVSSPTFVFLQEYPPQEGDGAVLAHVDAYRLTGPQDLPSIGWEGRGEELRDGAVLVVEWADRILGAMGDDWLGVRIAHHGDGRNLTLTAHGQWADRMPAVHKHLTSIQASNP